MRAVAAIGAECNWCGHACGALYRQGDRGTERPPHLPHMQLEHKRSARKDGVENTKAGGLVLNDIRDGQGVGTGQCSSACGTEGCGGDAWRPSVTHLHVHGRMYKMVCVLESVVQDGRGGGMHAESACDGGCARPSASRQKKATYVSSGVFLPLPRGSPTEIKCRRRCFETKARGGGAHSRGSEFRRNTTALVPMAALCACAAHGRPRLCRTMQKDR